MLPDPNSKPTILERAQPQCTYRCVVLPDRTPSSRRPRARRRLNAPTGAWCSLTLYNYPVAVLNSWSQCTYRCVVLPDEDVWKVVFQKTYVSMHLQVRGAP